MRCGGYRGVSTVVVASLALFCVAAANAAHDGAGGDVLGTRTRFERRLTCADGSKNGDETDVDCGGSCASKCSNGQSCSLFSDCASELCGAGRCYDAASVCTVGQWSSFGLCSAACGGGRRSRTRAVTAQLGATCSLSLAESDGCNEALCPAATAASTRAFVLMTVALHGMSAADFAFENRDAFRAGVAAATATQASLVMIESVQEQAARRLSLAASGTAGSSRRLAESRVHVRFRVELLSSGSNTVQNVAFGLERGGNTAVLLGHLQSAGVDPITALSFVGAAVQVASPAAYFGGGSSSQPDDGDSSSGWDDFTQFLEDNPTVKAAFWVFVVLACVGVAVCFFTGYRRLNTRSAGLLNARRQVGGRRDGTRRGSTATTDTRHAGKSSKTGRRGSNARGRRRTLGHVQAAAQVVSPAARDQVAAKPAPAASEDTKRAAHSSGPTKASAEHLPPKHREYSRRSKQTLTPLAGSARVPRSRASPLVADDTRAKAERLVKEAMARMDEDQGEVVEMAYDDGSQPFVVPMTAGLTAPRVTASSSKRTLKSDSTHSLSRGESPRAQPRPDRRPRHDKPPIEAVAEHRAPSTSRRGRRDERRRSREGARHRDRRGERGAEDRRERGGSQPASQPKSQSHDSTTRRSRHREGDNTARSRSRPRDASGGRRGGRGGEHDSERRAGRENRSEHSRDRGRSRDRERSRDSRYGDRAVRPPRSPDSHDRQRPVLGEDNGRTPTPRRTRRRHDRAAALRAGAGASRPVTAAVDDGSGSWRGSHRSSRDRHRRHSHGSAGSRDDGHRDREDRRAHPRQYDSPRRLRDPTGVPIHQGSLRRPLADDGAPAAFATREFEHTGSSRSDASVTGNPPVLGSSNGFMSSHGLDVMGASSTFDDGGHSESGDTWASDSPPPSHQQPPSQADATRPEPSQLRHEPPRLVTPEAHTHPPKQAALRPASHSELHTEGAGRATNGRGQGGPTAAATLGPIQAHPSRGAMSVTAGASPAPSPLMALPGQDGAADGAGAEEEEVDLVGMLFMSAMEGGESETDDTSPMAAERRPQ